MEISQDEINMIAKFFGDFRRTLYFDDNGRHRCIAQWFGNGIIYSSNDKVRDFVTIIKDNAEKYGIPLFTSERCEGLSGGHMYKYQQLRIVVKGGKLKALLDGIEKAYSFKDFELFVNLSNEIDAITGKYDEKTTGERIRKRIVTKQPGFHLYL